MKNTTTSQESATIAAGRKYNDYVKTHLVIDTLLSARTAIHAAKMAARLNRHSLLADSLNNIEVELEQLYMKHDRQLEGEK